MGDRPPESISRSPTRFPPFQSVGVIVGWQMSRENQDYWDERLRGLKKIRLKKVRKQIRKTKKGILAEWSFGPTHPELNGVRLTAIATPTAWKKIASYAFDHPDWFGLEFYSYLAGPASDAARRKQTQKQYFVNEIKIYSGVLFAFLRYWCKLPVTQWPEYLRKVLGLCKRDEILVKTARGGYDPKVLTDYCIAETFQDSIKIFRLNPFDDPANFYNTYIQDKSRPRTFTRHYIANKTPKEIENLAYTIPALNRIFLTLSVF